MNQSSQLNLPFETERYELYDAQALTLELNRRDFFRIVGGGLVVGFLLGDLTLGDAVAQRPGGQPSKDLAAWPPNGKEGKIVGADDKVTFEFGKLTKGKKLARTVSDKAATATAEKWTTEGTSVPKVDGRDFVTGKHQYATDTKRPGMLYGKVLRPPAF